MNSVRLKICCISSIEESRAAVSAGADAVGLVGHMPSGPGVITDDQIRAIAQSVPPAVSTFLLTSETDPDRVVEHLRFTRVSTAQLVDDEIDADVHAAIRSELPAVKVVQVVHVLDHGTVELALRHARTADALLLDSGNPGAVVRELGGTGRVHNWGVSREIVERSHVPVFLAGGLGPTNVGRRDSASQALRRRSVLQCAHEWQPRHHQTRSDGASGEIGAIVRERS